LISKIIKIVIGIVLIALGIWTITLWWKDVLALIRGGVGFVLILAGLIAFAVLD
jgi:hypothetical protein